MTSPNSDALLAALHSATSTKARFSPSDFFEAWFIERGQSLFFLFRKNLSVTNLPFGEIIALLRHHTQTSEAGRPSLTFASPGEFKSTIATLVDTFLGGGATVDSALRAFTDLYAPILSSLVAVRAFHGSCAVFVPPGMRVDLTAVCGMSGYIHSCGWAVYTRKVEKASKKDFFAALDRHLSRHVRLGEKEIWFAPYAHEDFSGFDASVKHVSSELKHGLEDVKIHVEKMSMGTATLSAVMADMRRRYRDRLLIPEPGDYRLHRPDSSRSTIWLIGETSIDPLDLRGVGDRRYFICYDQLFYNDSPFHIFDENKPAWLNHTTVPHTLMGAMLNLTKPWPEGASTTVCDPFVGTGTTVFELAKEQDVKIVCGDLNPLSRQPIADNVQVFSLRPDEIKGLRALVSDLVRELAGTDERGELALTGELFDGPVAAYKWAVQTAFQARSQEGQEGPNHARPPVDVAAALKKRRLADRLAFYIALRAAIRGESAFVRGSATWVEAFCKSAGEMLEELDDLEHWATRARSGGREHGNLVVFSARYSDRSGISPKRLERLVVDWGDGAVRFDCRDARLLEPDSCDVIATDPPYGFNTDEELLQLASLYRDFIGTLVRALRDDGHLVLCLPERSKSGKPVPFFARAEMVIRQVMNEARTSGRRLTKPALSLPSPSHLFQAPYYWESERALTRSILHFCFTKA